ncbi:MAG: DUF2238 domain-containing protein [Candidatus Omnitrophica bacterium]|nr:DUF2238 domain-containing protein [Candidatus Omnitrophota bacterium]
MSIRNLIEKNEIINKYILILTTILFIFLEIHALSLNSHFKYDLIMTLILLVFVFVIRRGIHLHWFHYLLFTFFLTGHNLGMYQLYDKFPLGIEYDYWVHGYFGVVSTMVIFRAITCRRVITDANTIIFLTIIMVLGISAIHELYEYAGAVLLGEGEGVLFIGAGDIDEWDTQKDMLNNLIGSIIGLIAYIGYVNFKKVLKNKS